MSAYTIRIEDVASLDCRVETHAWGFAHSHRDDIARHWRGLVAAKPAMFDGRVLLMHGGGIVEAGGARILRSAHFETNFSAFIAWRDFDFPNTGVQNCFSMAALRGNDGGFVLAEMGGHTASAGLVYFPAGTPDPGDVRGNILDLDGCVLRELEEETGLGAQEVSVDPGWTLVDAGPRLACMKTVRVDASAYEIARDLNARIAAQVDPELAGVRVVRDVSQIDPVRMPDFIVAYLTQAFGV